MKASAQPLVSIVIPTYNHARLIGRALDSVLKQTYANWEAIVVDNHSQDGTEAVLDAYRDERIKVLKIHNQGIIAASRNLGIRSAKGEWIAFLDSDDWWESDKLAACIEAAGDEFDMIYHDLRIIRRMEQKSSRHLSRSRALAVRAYDDLVLNGCAMPNSSVVLRKQLLDRTGALSEAVENVGWEDYDMWLRVAANGCRFVRLDHAYGFYWIGSGSVSNPRRTLANIDAFIQAYILADSAYTAIPWWCHYSRAKSYEELGDVAMADTCFKEAWEASRKFSQIVRTAIRWSLFKCRHKRT
jgi:glycosyltransferase involved in cell wall biosynthesis